MALALKSDFVIAALCLGNDLADNVAYRPYRRPKPYAALSADGQRLEIKGYPLPDTSGERGNLTDRVAFSQIAGLIDYAIDRLSEPRDEADLQRYDDGRLYAPPDKLSPDEQATVRDIFKLNELILDAINQRVTAALGPGRFAVLLVPTRYEIGQRLERWPGADPGAVAKGVLASLSRLGIPSIDGRAVIVEFGLLAARRPLAADRAREDRRIAREFSCQEQEYAQAGPSAQLTIARAGLSWLINRRAGCRRWRWRCGGTPARARRRCGPRDRYPPRLRSCVAALHCLR